MNKKEMEKTNDPKEYDWNAYFAKINDVCPWSQTYWEKDQLDIVEWTGEIFELSKKCVARVYKHPEATSTELENLSLKMNEEREGEEWLYSFPEALPLSTPVGVLIQQDTKMLNDIRKIYQEQGGKDYSRYPVVGERDISERGTLGQWKDKQGGWPEGLETANDVPKSGMHQQPKLGEFEDIDGSDLKAEQMLEEAKSRLEDTKKYSKEEVKEIVEKKFKERTQPQHEQHLADSENQKENEIPKEEQEKRTRDFQKIIIVTGGAGFIGSHLIAKLNHQGRKDILLVDDLTDPRKLHNIKTLQFQDYVDKSKFIELLGFLLENKMVERIYHLGAESSRHNTDGKYMMENNYQYTCNIMDLCYLNKIPLVFASSAAVYGQRPDANDTSDNYTPENYYALSKLQADKYSRKFMGQDQQTIIGLRYFNVTSNGDHEQHKDGMKSAVCWMTEQYKKDGYINLFEGSKEIKRDFTRIQETVWMTMNAMTKGRSGIYNIGTEIARSFYDMAMEIAEDESQIKYIPFPEDIAEGYQKYTKANMENACFGTTKRP